MRCSPARAAGRQPAVDSAGPAAESVEDGAGFEPEPIVSLYEPLSDSAGPRLTVSRYSPAGIIRVGASATICVSSAILTGSGTMSSVTNGRPLPKFTPVIVTVSPLAATAAPVTASGCCAAIGTHKETTTANLVNPLNLVNPMNLETNVMANPRSPRARGRARLVRTSSGSESNVW